MLNQKNTKKQGDVGMGAAVGWACTQGYTVSIPLTDSQPYDLIVDDGALKSMQVKTTRGRSTSGLFVVQLKTCGGNRSGMKIKNFDHSAVDLLFVLTDEGTQYVIPTSDFSASTSMTLGPQYAEYIVHLGISGGMVDAPG